MEVLVIGAGPAGLTAAYELNQHGIHCTILEADRVVGGISRTVNHKGYRFDLGGHRFFSKVPLVNRLWLEIMGDDFLLRPRLSRIHYKGHFFDYPLRVGNAFAGLGVVEAVLISLSYAKAKLFPRRPETTFEDWVSNRFGHRLFRIFFKTYTEKVWGIPCKEISADWAAQRIKNLSLLEVLRNTFVSSGKSRDGKVITTLIEKFRYPRLGPGMMWEKFESLLGEQGIETIKGRRVEKVWHSNGRIEAIGAWSEEEGLVKMSADHVISSMPLRELVEAMEPPPPDDVLKAAAGLEYRDFLTVVLIVKRKEVFPDNWIYIHSPEITMGRIQNYKNWSEEMVPDPDTTSLGLEYFVSKKEEMWSWPDERLIELGTKECVQLGFVEAHEVIDGTVVRIEKAYPIYDQERAAHVATLQEYVNSIDNLQAIGRNGQHHYNNQDHSMVTGIFAARNIVGETHDVWSVNVDQEYHEEAAAGGDQILPDREVPPQQEELDLAAALRAAFAHLDPLALGLAVALVNCAGLSVATVALMLRGGDEVTSVFNLLGHYLIGYAVAWAGLLIGLVEVGVLGYLAGAAIAWLHNAFVNAYIWLVRRRVEAKQYRDIL